jgi:4-azaleucine resistance transporter AzlC
MVEIPGSTKENGDPESIAREGMQAAWPICLGYFPIGLAFGVLAQKAGLHPVQIGLMSLLVFAGSSQFIAVSMLSGGATVLSIVITTFVINLRHILMSSSLAVYLRSVSRGWAALFAYGVTDESFAVNLTRFRNGNWDWRQAMVLNHSANFSGQFIPAGAFGIDYALIAMFLCLLVFQLRGKLYTVTAIIAGVLAVIIALLVPGNVYIVLASILAATFGVFFRRLARMFHESPSRDHEDGCATGQLVPRYRGIGSEAYLNGTSQEPTPEDARKDGHIRGRSK